MHKEFHSAFFSNDLTRRLFEGADKFPANDLALGLRVSHSSKCIKELLTSIDDFQTHASCGDEVFFHLLGFSSAQQAVIDEDTGELISDRLLDQGGCYC